MKILPVCPVMCGTCPFREGSPYAYLREQLLASAMTATRICHSTGSANAINRRTGIPKRSCRGTRDFQLQMMHRLGFLPEPTDKAWTEAAEKIKGRPRRPRTSDPKGRPD